MMNLFFETYECKIDDKGRIKLPAQLLKMLQENAVRELVVKRAVFHSCLEVYPPKPWEKMMQKINGLNRFVKKNADFIRMFTAGVKKVEIDGSDRVLVNKDLKVFAGLEKDIVINGVGDYFEIWDKAAYELELKNSETDFAALAEDVMGNTEEM